MQQIWDQSSLMTAVCPQKYKYSKIDGWRSKYDSEAAAFGTFAHECFEYYDTATLHGGVTEGVEAAFNHALENGEFLNELQTSQYHLPCLLRAIVWYGEQFKNDMFTTAVDNNGKPLIEVRFEVPIPGREDRRFSGRIDKIIQDGDEFILVDRKFTKKQLNRYYFDQYSPSIQLSSYVWALRNVLQLPVSKAMIEAHQIGVTLARCERRIFPIPEDRATEFGEELDVMALSIDRAHETGRWNRDLRMCGMFGGCEYRTVCNAPRRQELDELQQHFKQRESIDGHR